MNKDDLQEMQTLALKYGDPLRGKMLALKAEVERLQEEVEIWKATCGEVSRENQRLRQSLEEIAEHGGVNILGKTCAEIAHKALEEKE
jgi:hypothetical protein